ncbi:helix-turn-helix domain-containing protein [Pseudomonas aeruginosa]|uniref:helix-turn-helix domain-containing protein n=1 Tax=Pseudomonas aeruginosa TaxID=287 RepID=UPI00093C5D12|nr:helix-turn-helix transcriptional regulator [Pseudomonas aeruginosa]
MRKHNQAFGKALRELRKQKRLTQEKLGFEAGLDRTYISVLELGQRSPTLDTLFSLCEVLDVSLVDLAARTQARLDDMHDRDDAEGSPTRVQD